MTVNIEKIILKVSGKEIELSLDEAKQLKDILGEMFGKDNTIVIPTIVPYVYPDRTYPSYPSHPYYPYVTWSCGTDGNTVVLSTTTNNTFA